MEKAYNISGALCSTFCMKHYLVEVISSCGYYYYLLFCGGLLLFHKYVNFFFIFQILHSPHIKWGKRVKKTDCTIIEVKNRLISSTGDDSEN